MKLGYFTLFDNLPIFGEVRRNSGLMLGEIAEEAAAADALGFSSFWVAEHHGPNFGQLPAPAPFLGYLATITERIVLGPACVILPISHPVRVAEEYAVLDWVSKGRIALAVGRGNEPADYTLFGVDYEESRERLREGTELIRMLWTTREVTYFGRHYRIEEPFTLNQYPLQRPHPPIALAAYSPPTVHLAAELGVDLMLSPLGVGMAFGGLEQAAAAFREAAARAGHPHLKMICSYYCALATSRAEEEEHRARLLRFIHGLLEIAAHRPTDRVSTPLQAARQRVLAMQPSDVGPDLLITGDAETVIKHLEWCASLGIDEIILDVNFGCYPHRDTMRQLHLLAREVLPVFHQRPLTRPAAESAPPVGPTPPR
jgi:alkanesulfonate monooxygenase SsuD/methylene tetrahydromethanopterin reductase-like flavin-dependent oxidoreductase (luciferase family)